MRSYFGTSVIRSDSFGRLVRHGTLAALLVVIVPAPLEAEQEPAGVQTSLLVGGSAAPFRGGRSAQELQAALAEIGRRLAERRPGEAPEPAAANVADQLRAARTLIESMAPLIRSIQAERNGLRDELAAAREELEQVRAELTALEAERQGAASTKATLAQLEQDLAAARERINELSRAAAEVEPIRQQLADVQKENADLRLVATSSVEEVRALSEQLLAALAERAKLVEASVELSSSGLLGDLERATEDDRDQAAGSYAAASVAPPPLSDESASSRSMPAEHPPEPADGRAETYPIALALVADAADVGREWQRLTKLHPRLTQLQLQPARPVSIPGKGTFHRVLAGAFRTMDEAQAACRQLQAEGGDCMAMVP